MIVINVFAALWILARAAPTAAPVVGQHTSNSDNVPLASARYLQPRADGTIDALAFLATLTATFIKYNVGYIPSPSDVPTTSDPLISTNAQDEGTVGISVRNTIPPQSESVSILSTPRGLNLGYHGSVTVGDQGRAQTFPAEYDTGSSLLVIPGRRCGDAQSCTGRIKYDEQGVEGKSDSGMDYDGGDLVRGQHFYDNVTVAGFTATDSELLSVTEADSMSAGHDGQLHSIMGFGMGTGEDRNPNFFEDLVQQVKVTTPEFSFYFGRSKSKTADKSALTIGGRDTFLMEGAVLAKITVSNRVGHWELAMNGLRVAENEAIPVQFAIVAIDTGINFVTMPVDAAAALFKTITRAYPLELAVEETETTSGHEAYAYPCPTDAVIEFNLGGIWLAMNTYDFSVDRFVGDQAFGSAVTYAQDLADALAAGTEYCISSIVGANTQSTSRNSETVYVLGQPFLRNWYTIFVGADPLSVSFAKAAGNQ